MTKKHFEAAAAIVRELALASLTLASVTARTKARAEPIAIAGAYAELFAQFNPRFDRDRFFQACGLPELVGQ